MAFGRLRRAWRKLQQWRLDPPLAAATPAELEQVGALRAEFRAFPEYDLAGVPPSTAEWHGNLNDLRRDILKRDPRRFTRFDVVRKTMFVDEAAFLPVELAYLRAHPDWARRWEPALRECGAGYPPAYRDYPATSGNLLTHCYHLARFMDVTGREPAQHDLVLEFGGGYGSLCRVLHRCGFAGRYVIFDFPHFSALQRYFLRSAGITVHENAAAFRAATSGVLCVSTLEALDAALPPDAREALFVATWSLSEAPADLRQAFVPRVQRMRAFLIGFQDRFNEMDNQVWFGRDWPAALPHVQWTRLPIAHLPGNSYFFGIA